MKRARLAFASLAFASLVFASLTACNVDPYLLDHSLQLDASLVVDGGDDTGDGGSGGPPDAATCTASGPDDTCDNIDNDCNGTVDDPFDKNTDAENCGVCGHRCSEPNAVVRCEDAVCQFEQCLPGFTDLDPTLPGCEYRCPVFPPQDEQCNGVDEDCDGVLDNDLPAPPTGLCRATAGTPCAGTTMTCDTRGGVTTWYCAYGAGVEFDPSVANGIALEETKCDGLDGDCDGEADDSFADLDQECDNGMQGTCRDPGKRRCDPTDTSQTVCDLSVLPDATGSSAEVCNGLDDDCDGVIDNPTGAGRVLDDMVHVQRGSFNFYIYTYEASRADATAVDSGTAAVRSCSRPGVLPWTQVTYGVAQAACTTSGKRLCTGAEWQAACEGAANQTYPYGASYAANTCNGEDYDGVSGGADDDVVVATGEAATCVSQDGLFDMSGNVKEWTNDVRANAGAPESDDIVAVRGGAFNTPAAGLTCDFDLSRAVKVTVLPGLGFRCCSNAAP